MIGKTILHYNIIEKLGEGGMGVVYKAEDTKLKRDVAIKFLPKHIAANQEERERFKIEAQAAASLNHPNIATIHAIEESDYEMFIVMEYIEGKELKDLINIPLNPHSKGDSTTAPFEGGARRVGDVLPVDDVINYAIQIAEGLQAAHKKGIVHRDIKSSNIMITEDGKIKIMDFGLAKVRGGPQVTKVGTTVGTVAYMSPEQARGEAVDHHTDIWSFGVVLYEMLTGQLPFGGDYEQAVIYSVINEQPAEVRSLRTDVPATLQLIINKCLEKDRSNCYEITQEMVDELKKAQPQHSGTTVPVARQSKLPWIIAAALIIIIAVAFYFFLSPASQTPANNKTIAVLPFTNMSNNPDDEYFSDGMTEDILTHLAKISDLKVISRTTMMQYKGTKKSLKDIGKELDAGVVLEGSVRRASNQVRITAQLIDANTDEHLWAENYDRNLKDIFAIQSDVAQKIAMALEAKLSKEEKERLEKVPTTSTDAYNLYLRGRNYWNQRSAEAMPKALKFFEDAVAIDPNYALAWTGIADCFLVGSGIYFGISPQEAQAKTKSAVLKALALDSTLAEAHATLAGVEDGNWNWPAAERSFQRAIELNPSYATAHQWHGEFLCAHGRFREGLSEIKRAVELDPLSLIAQSQLGWVYLASRDADKALAESQRVLNMEPDFYDALECQAEALILAHRPESEIFPAQLKRDSVAIPLEAKECSSLREAFVNNGLHGYWKTRLDILLDRNKKNNLWWQGFLVENYAQLGDAPEALKYLRKMYEAHDPLLTLIRIWVYFDPIRSEPGFQEIIQLMKMTS
jgi:serine/threonine protein kinase/Tfp pilus assembly protein PilF